MWYRRDSNTERREIWALKNFVPNKKRKVQQFDNPLDDPVSLNPVPNLPLVEPEPKLPIAPEPVLPKLEKELPEPEPQAPPILEEPILEEPQPVEQEPNEIDELYGEDADNPAPPRDDALLDAPNTAVPQPDVPQDVVEPEPEPFQPELGTETPEHSEDEDKQDQDDQQLDVKPDMQFPMPPLHDNCHCEVVTMPGGRQIWKANEGACNDCLAIRDAFNAAQAAQFGT